MQSKIGEIYMGTVTGLTNYGAFVKLENGETGMVHISEVASVYVKDIKDHLTEGQQIKVKVLAINDNKISLSAKAAEPPRPAEDRPKRNNFNQRRDNNKPSGNFRGRQDNTAVSSQPKSFEEMMAKFKQESDEKMSILKKTTDFKGSNRRGNK